MENASDFRTEDLPTKRIIHFDIDAQALASALIEFGEQAGLSVLLQHELRAVKTGGLHGSYEYVVGLKELLADTGLDFRVSEGGIIVSQPVAQILPIPAVAQKKTSSSLLGRIGAVLIGALLGGPATAESADNTAVIEEVIVTAQKREASLRKTPIAITAITAETIEKDELYDIRKLEKLAPSLTYNQGPAGVQLYIRGVGQDAPTIGTSAGVAVYVDGVYHGHQFANAAAYFDAERFEVVRGPQGTLYGRNSTGGNINVTTALPDFEPSAKINLSVGSFSKRRIALTGNLPIVDDVLAVRGTLLKQERDGYRDNLVTGKDIDTQDLDAGSLSFLYTPTENIEFILRADYQSEDFSPRPASYLGPVPGSGLSPVLFGARFGGEGTTDVFHDSVESKDTEFKGISGTVTWQLGDLTFKSITGYRDTEYSSFTDADGTDLAFFTILTTNGAEEYSQEFNLLGTSMDERLRWIVGLNYYRDEPFSKTTTLAPFFAFLFPPFPPLPLLNGQLTTTPFFDLTFEEELTSVGFFVQGTYELSDKMRATIGYRYTRDEKDAEQFIISNLTPPSVQCRGLKSSDEWTPSTWKVGLDGDVSDNILIYGSVSRGFKAGGFSLGVCGNSVDEELITAYEAGMKGLFFDQQLGLNVAAYYYDYTDLQVRTFQNLRVEFNNAAESRIYGLETEFVIRFSSSFQVDGGINWQSARYEKGTLDDAMVPGQNPVDISGNQLLRAPDLKGNLGLQYTYQFSSGASIDARYDVAYSDSFYVDAHENSFAQIDSRTTQNFRVTWSSADDGKLYVQLFGENIGDEEYLEWRLNVATVGGTAGIWAPPRTYGIRAGYRTN